MLRALYALHCICMVAGVAAVHPAIRTRGRRAGRWLDSAHRAGCIGHVHGNSGNSSSASSDLEQRECAGWGGGGEVLRARETVHGHLTPH